MTPERRDELAELAWSIAEFLPKAEAKSAVAAMFRTQIDCEEADAWALIVRGKSLARQATSVAARQKGERV